ncbi:MAG: hypothetical protein FJ379_03365 [Verrucomicrobia bacterium]|nr:hypothetical protein [Verrucomicrobiota bacterium]
MESHRTPAAYRIADTVSGLLILALVVFAPWAFGCTVAWAVHTVTVVGYTLGALLLVKAIARWREDYTPDRWVEHDGPGRWIVRLFASLTLVMLAMVLTGWLNGRADVVFSDVGPALEYRERTPISWLPASYDAARSLRGLVRYTSWALIFWATRDWVVTKTRRERHDSSEGVFPTARVRQFLWTLCISSAVLALVAIAHRLEGSSDKVLWLMKFPLMNSSEAIWGSYPYRANGAQYFNLVWPVCLGFWWSLRERSAALEKRPKGFGNDPSMILLPCTVLLASCPILATSRGGVLIMLGLLGGALLILALAKGRTGRTGRLVAAVLFLITLGGGWFLGGEELQRRFLTVFEDKMSNRLAIYEVAHRMADEAGVWGLGAESYTGLNGLYRTKPEDNWEGFVHDDWLEARINIGWAGVGLVIALLAMLPAHWSSGRGIQAPREFTGLLALSLIGILVHAKFDLPFQITSLVVMVLLLSAIGLCSAPRPVATLPSRHKDPVGSRGRRD